MIIRQYDNFLIIVSIKKQEHLRKDMQSKSISE